MFTDPKRYLTCYIDLRHLFTPPHHFGPDRLLSSRLGNEAAMVRFAPLNVPLHRRLETFALTYHILSIPVWMSFFLLCCAIPLMWPLVIIYLLYYASDNSSENGGVASRYSPKFRSVPLWKYFANYFPITLHRTQELPPAFVYQGEDLDPETPDDNDEGHAKSKSIVLKLWKVAFWWYYLPKHFLRKPEVRPTGRRYIFGYHPHGIIGMGAIGAIATEGAGWSKLFPGIPVSLLTLANNFRIPLYREYLMSLGIASVSRRSCEALLKRGQSICIVIGGAQESLLAHPGHMDLVLKRRKGFIKLALEVGNTDLVPVMAFGENDLYQQVNSSKSSRLYKLQSLVKNALGFTLPLMHARGVFNYDVGIIPYRRPINVVVGKPIPIPHIPNPSADQVNRYQIQYMTELKELYDKYKDKCSNKDLPVPELTFVE